MDETRIERGRREGSHYLAKLVVAPLFAVGILLSVGCAPEDDGGDGPVHIVSWGGNLQEQLVDKWISRAAESADISYEVETWNGDMAALALRIRRDLNTWDLVHVEAQDAFRDDRGELFAQFPDRSVGRLEPRLKQKPVIEEGFGMPVMEWAYVLTFQRDQLPASTSDDPTWADLWNLEEYPGARGIRNWPMGIIEIALISLGRDVNSSLYAPDLTRPHLEEEVADALERLDEIYDTIIWWDTGDQLQRGVATGEFSLATGYSGRVGFEHRNICPDPSAADTCRIGINPDTAIVATDWWVIPKGARRAEKASKLLEAMYSSEEAISGAQDFSEALGYRIPIEGLTVAEPIDRFLRVGSSANPNAQVYVNERFWSDHFTWINDRWQLWRSTH
jgi:putative spermidine/putrescine transport system substrate-binding protein